MRVLLAGASGAVGRHLIPQLLAAGHSVTGISRTDTGAATIRSLGADALLCDALDGAQVLAAVQQARPDAIVSELTDLPKSISGGKIKDMNAGNNRVRREGTANLLAATRACGVRRFVTQSAAFWYAPSADGPRDETAPFYVTAHDPIGEAARTMTAVEQSVTGATDLEGLAVRYGTLYGSGTWYARDGDIGQRVQKRMYPVIGNGQGVTSFLHLADAAFATLAVLERGRAGEAYNAVDDEPAAMRDWLPVFCKALGAPPPLSIPLLLARQAVGAATVDWLATSPGAQNGKLKAEFGWTPQYASWREGFPTL
jgi:2-alkyl-3-oxoalkanoate reductase